MKPARYIVREEQHTWVKRQAHLRDTSASAVVRVALDLLKQRVLTGAVDLDSELARREDGS